MILFCSFIVLGAAAGITAAASAGMLAHWYDIWRAILPAAAYFAACNAAFLIVNYMVSLFVDVNKHVERPRPYFAWNVGQAAELICIYCGLRVRMSGTELIPDDRRFLLVSNHRSNFDPIIVMNKLRAKKVAFVSKPSNLKIPLVGKFIHECCFMPIDRENARNAVATINMASDYIKDGVSSVGIYPEGTRSRSGRMGQFHAGSFKIAQKANAPIVVAAVSGTEKRRGFLAGKDVRFDIIGVINAEDAVAEKTVDLAERVRAMMEKHFSGFEGAVTDGQ